MATEQQYYAALLDKYLRNECTAQEQAALSRWYESLTKELPIPGQDELREMAQQNWLSVANRVEFHHQPRRQWFQLINWQKVAAAFIGFLILFGIGWFSLIRKNPIRVAGLQPSSHQTGWIVKTNHTTRSQKITLIDGSSVWLEPGSELTYSGQFSSESRSVQLKGKAFFDIAHDPVHPFLVQTQWLDVKVLGTSFTVSAFAAGNEAEVKVQSGRVEVVRKQDNAYLVLTPNERVVVSKEPGPLVKSLVEQPVVVNAGAVTNQFNFADTPIADVFKTLEQAYRISIQFDPTVFANCTLTAKLTDQPLFTKLDMICSSIGASYTIQGTQIVISGSGCAE